MILKVTDDGDTIEMTPSSNFSQINFSVNIDVEKDNVSAQVYQERLIALLQLHSAQEHTENIDEDATGSDCHELSNFILDTYATIQNGQIMQLRYPGGDEELAELMQ